MNTETSPLIADDDDDILKQPASQTIIVTPVKPQFTNSNQSTSPTIIIEASPPLESSSKILNTNNNELNRNIILNPNQSNLQDSVELSNKTKILQNENLDTQNKSSSILTGASKQNIIIPNIVVRPGGRSSTQPATNNVTQTQPKRNVAVKNTSGHLNRNNNYLNTQLNNNSNVTRANIQTVQTSITQCQPPQQAFRVNEDEIMNLDDKEQDSCDEYISANKNNREDSEISDSDDSINRRKMTRIIKKPKIYEEFLIDSDTNNSAQESIITNISNNTIQQTTSRITIEPNIKSNSPKPSTPNQTQATTNSTSNGLKFTARKSTAPQQINSNLTTVNRQPTSKNLITQTISNTNQITQILNKNPQVKPLINGSSDKNLNTIPQNISRITSNPLITTIPTQTISSNLNNQKQYKNKMVSCKPFYQSKATECYPIVKDASTQIDLDELKLNHTVIPVPVPINVPVPMCMYQAPMPVPLLIPVPIPVPVFIPTTKKTYDRVHRRIKKLRKKLPSDPYEFEILLYAEKLAREEGIPGFEDSSDGESDTEQNLQSVQESQDQMLLTQDSESSFKWNIGIKVFNTWLNNKIENLKLNKIQSSTRLPNDLLKLKNEELNLLLAEFLTEVRKPNGEIYAPESIYYISLGIQYYLQEKGRVENIFLDSALFDNFQESFNEIALRYKIRIDTDGQVASRIEEEILWESKQLGAFSPFVLLNTILYFNTKYFFLDKVESHKKLSFSNVKKHSKRNIGPNGEDYGKTVFLRYYPDCQGLEQVIYEQGENYDNPLRCPVELYNFYLSKCPESVKNRNDIFYLLPEKASLPTSPVWFSSQPLSEKMLDRMLNRIKMVKEVNELLLAAAPSTTPLIVQMNGIPQSFPELKIINNDEQNVKESGFNFGTSRNYNVSDLLKIIQAQQSTINKLTKEVIFFFSFLMTSLSQKLIVWYTTEN
ncbi:unnamed protein product [Brachionus calyciflorus]|uniref:DUF3504 domain-containing protein n=1 Tax=Brachionus calyciflorus TaxID=104777 RepID=A0A813P141_9BILA|nr:unnamed protein product [Brachionus calyciflorus]